MMFRCSILAVTAGLLLSVNAPDARADAFGCLLDRIAKRAVDKVTETRSQRKEGRDEKSPVQADEAETSLPAPPGVVPWPLNAGRGDVVRPTQFQFSADLVAQQKRYRDASAFSCSTCEGSLEIDSWRKAFGHTHETYSSWSKILETWTVGRAIPWRGKANDGLITVVSEVAVGGFPCRQLTLRITTRGKQPVSVETPGLICLGRQDEYSGKDTWHEVF